MGMDLPANLRIRAKGAMKPGASFPVAPQRETAFQRQVKSHKRKQEFVRQMRKLAKERGGGDAGGEAEGVT